MDVLEAGVDIGLGMHTGDKFAEGEHRMDPFDQVDSAYHSLKRGGPN